MATTARLDLSVWRNDDLCSIPIKVRGLDLTGANLAMDIRLAPDTPGDPELALRSGAVGNGLYVEGATVEDGVNVAILRILIDRNSMQALPYAGEVGDDAGLAYALLINGVTRLVGRFTVLAHAYGSNSAPTDRPAGAYSVASARLPASGAIVTIAGNEIIELSIDGVDQLSPLIAEASAAAARAEAAADGLGDVSERLERTDSALTATGPAIPADRAGYYGMNGTFIADANGPFRAANKPVTPGERLSYTGTVTGGSVAMAQFKNASGAVIPGSQVNPGANGRFDSYQDELFIAPAGAASVDFNGTTAGGNGAVLPVPALRRGMSVDSVGQIAAGLIGFQPAGTPVPGYVSNGSGAVIDDNAFAQSYRNIYLSVKPGDRLRYSGTVSGGSTAMAVYYGPDGAFVPGSAVNPGVNGRDDRYDDVEITVPAGYYGVRLTSTGAGNIMVERFGPVLDGAARLRSLAADVAALQDGAATSYWSGKTWLWFGTSIPTSGYPQLAAAQLGATAINRAIASSPARFGVAAKRSASDKYGIAGCHWLNVILGLSATSAEKEDLIANWATYRTLVIGDPPAALTGANADMCRNSSWQVRIADVLSSVDLICMDHGHNDYFMNPNGTDAGALGGGSGDMRYLPTSLGAYPDQVTGVGANADPSRDRGTFLGAMLYLIDQIRRAKRTHRPPIFGHYEWDRKRNIAEGQIRLQELTGLPLIRSWELTGWSQQVIRTADGSKVQQGGSDLTITRVWMDDDLHPYEDRGRNLLANIYAAQLERVR